MSAVRPATRYGRYVVFEGGKIVRLPLWAWAWCALGFPWKVKTP